MTCIYGKAGAFYEVVSWTAGLFGLGLIQYNRVLRLSLCYNTYS